MNPMAGNAGRRRLRAGGHKSGMTLVEVLLATVILGVCIVGLMKALSMCVEIFRGASFWQDVATVAAAAEERYPFVVSNDPQEDLTVPPDNSIFDGWTYERTVDDDEDEDGIYKVTIRIIYGNGGPGAEAEFVRLVYSEGKEGTAGIRSGSSGGSSSGDTGASRAGTSNRSSGGATSSGSGRQQKGVEPNAR